MSMSSARRRELKAQAHALQPVLQTGANGVTDAVIAEAEIAIEHHELIKLRLAGADRQQRSEMAACLAEKLHAEIVGQIGMVVILYRESRKNRKKKKS